MIGNNYEGRDLLRIQDIQGTTSSPCTKNRNIDQQDFVPSLIRHLPGTYQRQADMNKSIRSPFFTDFRYDLNQQHPQFQASSLQTSFKDSLDTFRSQQERIQNDIVHNNSSINYDFIRMQKNKNSYEKLNPPFSNFPSDYQIGQNSLNSDRTLNKRIINNSISSSSISPSAAIVQEQQIQGNYQQQQQNLSSRPDQNTHLSNPKLSLNNSISANISPANNQQKQPYLLNQQQQQLNSPVNNNPSSSAQNNQDFSDYLKNHTQKPYFLPQSIQNNSNTPKNFSNDASLQQRMNVNMNQHQSPQLSSRQQKQQQDQQQQFQQNSSIHNEQTTPGYKQQQQQQQQQQSFDTSILSNLKQVETQGQTESKFLQTSSKKTYKPYNIISNDRHGHYIPRFDIPDAKWGKFQKSQERKNCVDLTDNSSVEDKTI